MKTVLLLAISIIIFSFSPSDCVASTTVEANPKATAPPKKRMRAFKSEEQLQVYLKKYRKRLEAPPPPNVETATVQVSAARSSVDDAASITNVQHEGVDEGGIVKVHGDHLVLLRRGRLFTISLGKHELKPISVVDAFGPEINPEHSWYDELLISGDTIIVIGYNYERGGTEVGIFTIDDTGNLTYRSTYHLRSDDYYSSRNYASRFIRGKLIFYSPLSFSGEDDPQRNLPAIRKWHKSATEKEFKRIVSARRVFLPEYEFKTADDLAFHTVTVCDPAGGELRCEATSVIGPPGHAFYVSPESVYVWTTDYPREDQRTRVQSLLYRMPLDGSAPSGLKVSGGPIDQFSFLESADGYLNVLVCAYAAGDAMWESEFATGDASLLRVPLASFSDGGEEVSAANYRKLPMPKGYVVQNRFVGDYLFYGVANYEEIQAARTKQAAYAVRWTSGDPIEVGLTHSVERIESIGGAALIVGTNADELHFSVLSLGHLPKVEYDYVRKGAQGELRSHGFFYKPDGPKTGILGLPVVEPNSDRHQYLNTESASIVYLRNDSLRLKELGTLAASPATTDDKCRASCVDWYGNSRPLFLRGRVFALLGYELVEGVLTLAGIREVRRINYAPQLNRHPEN